MFQEMGRSAAEHPDTLVFELLAAGFAANCYDGQYFFDTDHPVTALDGTASSVSNVQSGSGEPWYLLDTSRAIRPFVFQERRPFANLVSKDRPEDDNVFNNNEFIYGCDGRGNAGYGLWQLAFGSKATLDATNYKAARDAMMNMTGDNGRKLGIRPTLLICGPDNESAARKLLNSEIASGGETNEWKGTAELLVTPWIG
jgi:phage major head subunit gpT-like protein